MARTAEASGTVIVNRRQVVTFSGRHLASVELTDHGLVVTKKRERGGRYDSHTFPLVSVVAFVEGDGGRSAPAYASVITTTVIKKVSGDISYDQGWIVVTDENGEEHRFRTLSDTDVVVIEEAEKPDRPSRKTKNKKSARKSRETDETDEEDDETDGDDGDDLGEEDDEAEEPVKPRKSVNKAKVKDKTKGTKASSAAPAKGKAGRRTSSF